MVALYVRGALWSEDTQIMVDALRKLGFEVLVEPDPAQYSNRTITVRGLNGWIPAGGTPAAPLELFVGNAGTAARFLAAFVCLGKGVYKLVGTERMHQRPQKGLFNALRQLGYRVEPAPGDKLPALIYGSGPLATPTPCIVDITESSQFCFRVVTVCQHWKVVSKCCWRKSRRIALRCNDESNDRAVSQVRR